MMASEFSFPDNREFVRWVVRRIKEQGYSESGFGREHFRDPNLLRELKGGRDIRMSKARAIYEALR